MAQNPAAQTEDSRSMPLDKHFEGSLFMLGGKPVQELPVGCLAVTGQLANVA
jgi:hypothetical protein